MAKKGLGRGLSSLIPETLDEADSLGEKVLSIQLSDLVPNPEQPRKDFPPEQITELAQSIRENGIIQPLVVEKYPESGYMIIAGERRFRAAAEAGLKSVPAIVKSFTSAQKLEIGLIENIQREDLNPLEEAQGYQALMERFGHTQEDLARKLGKSRSAVANTLRLLRLPDAVKEAIAGGELSAGHARALLSVHSEYQAELPKLFSHIQENSWSVRRTEQAARLVNSGRIEEAYQDVSRASSEQSGNDQKPEVSKTSKGSSVSGKGSSPGTKAGSEKRDPALWNLEEELIRRMGTKVEIRGDLETGRIEFHYFNRDDLDRLYNILIGE